MTGRGEDLLVGLFALALIPVIAWRIVRGLRTGRLPLYRTSIDRSAGGGRFELMLGLHVLSLILIALIAADLLLELGLKERL